MKFLFKRKDGGPESNVTGYFLIEAKSLFTVVLLRFDRGSRENYHSHAFNCLSWVLAGRIQERQWRAYGHMTEWHLSSFLPFITRRNTFHKVYGRVNSTWLISIRGPWTQQWAEYDPKNHTIITLSHGRKVESTRPA